jgi:molybdate transport system permease protein
MRRARIWRTPIPWLGALLAVYLLSPIAAFGGRLATSPRAAAPGVAGALAVSAETATIATAVILIAGVPLAYHLAHGRSRSSTAVAVALQLPIAIPPLMSGILLLYLIGPYSTLGRMFGGRLTDDRAGIVLAQVFVAAPFLIVSARSAFAAVDPSLEEVAATLGYRRWGRFVRVALPAATPGIVAGLLLAWLRAFGEFGATVILAYHPYSLPVFTFLQFGTTGLNGTLVPTAATLAAATIVVLVVAGTTNRGILRAASRSRPKAPAVVTPAPPRFRHRPVSLEFDLRGEVGGFALALRGRTAGRLALVGRTGAGKSLALRILAGLHSAAYADLRLGEQNLAALPVEARRIGYLPQGGGLLPHLPVRRQVGWGVNSDAEAAAYWMQRLDLMALADRLPDELSGGQRQRVALARTLAAAPRLLLLDEPLTGIDTPTRAELRRELRRLQREARITTVLVTHDPEDVALLADDVIVLDRGSVLQSGAVDEVYRCPGNAEVARLLGVDNAIEVTVAAPGMVITDDGVGLAAPASTLPIGARAIATVDAAAVALGVGATRGVVLDVTGYPGSRWAEVGLGAHTTIRVAVPERDGPPRPGMPVMLAIPGEAIRVSAITA